MVGRAEWAHGARGIPVAPQPKWASFMSLAPLVDYILIADYGWLSIARRTTLLNSSRRKLSSGRKERPLPLEHAAPLMV